MKSRDFHLLIVEDNPGDARLVEDALQAGAVPKRITVVTNGEDALNYLRRSGPFANATRPDLVLLDLNLPRADGLEVLRAIKTDPALCTITVVVLTTSQAQRDVHAAYSCAANCYLVKPLHLDEFYALIRGLEEFWMRLATLPSGEQGPATQDLAAGKSGPLGTHVTGAAPKHRHTDGRRSRGRRWAPPGRSRRPAPPCSSRAKPGPARN